MAWRKIGLYVVAGLAIALAPVHAHETDHYSIPPGRDIADLGDHFTAWAYEALASAVEEANEDARAAIDRGDEQRLAEIGTHEYIFDVTWRQFPNAYFVIEDLEQLAGSDEKRAQHPGQVVRYHQPMGGVYIGAYFPLDPRQLFRVWHASVIKAYGVYFGTDKVGHFTDMGKNYHIAYRNALDRGASEEEALAAVRYLGTDHLIFSESALLGYWTAGAYSNGDLASNWAGFLFYRNLTETVDVAGHERPPLLEWDGRQWSLAEHVRRGSDFFSYFITDHWDEALNPSVYDFTMRQGFRRNIVGRAEHVLWRYRDVNGNRRLPIEFLEKAVELSTMGDDDYGHRGTIREVITLAEAFEPFEPGAPLNARNDRGHTPLHDAVAWGNLAETRRLLERGADVHARVEPSDAWRGDAGCTPLHLAARTGRADMVRLLLEHGASVEELDDRQASVTHHAAGHPQVMAMLLDAGAPVDGRTQQGQTALHWTAAKDDDPSVRLLLDRGAPPDVADATGRTAMHLAAEHASAATVGALAARADVEFADAVDTRPLHVAAARPDASSEDVVRVLLDAGADPLATDSRGRTALHEAARSGRPRCLALLAGHGGRIEHADAFGNTPLHLASRQGRDGASEWLIDRGAPLNVANAAGKTALHEAAFAGDVPLVNRMLAAGADPAMRDGEGRTASAIATANGHRGVATSITDYEIDSVFARPR